MANFKIALTAGHYRYTPGKRCLRVLDPNETREWVLNDRIADKVEKLLAANYTGYELLRTDDTSGETAVELARRTGAANRWGADFYLSIHHNAGIGGGSGGGIMAYVHTNPQTESVAWQKALYDALIGATGLKGNRAEPLTRANLHECRETIMPAVLLELGFMDSSTDVPIILTEEYADQCAGAIVNVLAERGKLTKKEQTATTALYNSIDEVPGYAQPTIRKLLDKGWMAGYSDGRLGLTEDMVRIFAIHDRAGLYDN